MTLTLLRTNFEFVKVLPFIVISFLFVLFVLSVLSVALHVVLRYVLISQVIDLFFLILVFFLQVLFLVWVVFFISTLVSQVFWFIIFSRPMLLCKGESNPLACQSMCARK